MDSVTGSPVPASTSTINEDATTVRFVAEKVPPDVNAMDGV
jgi:hypothetical protein